MTVATLAFKVLAPRCHTLGETPVYLIDTLNTGLV